MWAIQGGGRPLSHACSSLVRFPIFFSSVLEAFYHNFHNDNDNDYNDDYNEAESKGVVQPTWTMMMKLMTTMQQMTLMRMTATRKGWLRPKGNAGKLPGRDTTLVTLTSCPSRHRHCHRRRHHRYLHRHRHYCLCSTLYVPQPSNQ